MLPAQATSPGINIRKSSQALHKQTVFSTSISQLSRNSPQVLSERHAWWSRHRMGLLFSPACSSSASHHVHPRDVPGCTNIWLGWLAWTTSGLGTGYEGPGHHGRMLMSAESVGQNSNVPPPYSCETSILFLVFYERLNNCYLGQNLIQVSQQWTIMTWRWFGFVFCCSKPDGERIVIFPWGSQRRNQILLKIPQRMIASFTFYCSTPQQ